MNNDAIVNNNEGSSSISIYLVTVNITFFISTTTLPKELYPSFENPYSDLVSILLLIIRFF